MGARSWVRKRQNRGCLYNKLWQLLLKLHAVRHILANNREIVRTFASWSLKCGLYLKKSFERCGCWRLSCLALASVTCESQLSHLSETNAKRTASRATPFKEKKTSIEVEKRAKPRKKTIRTRHTMVPNLDLDSFSAAGFFLPQRGLFLLWKGGHRRWRWEMSAVGWEGWHSQPTDNSSQLRGGRPSFS